MRTTNTAAARYSQSVIALHWILALLILLNFVLVWVSEDMPKEQSAQLTGYHVANGVLILGLTVLRILLRLIQPAVPFVSTLKPWEAALAKLVHGSLYFLMLAIPLVGWAMSSAFSGGKPINFFGLFNLPGLPLAANKELAGSLHEAHEIFATLMLVLLALHVVAALKHQIIDRDGTMRRIAPWMK